MIKYSDIEITGSLKLTGSFVVDGVATVTNAVTASYAENVLGNKTITDIISNPAQGLIVVAGGIPHIIRGSNIVSYASGTGLAYPGPFGTKNMHQIPLPTAESGSVQDAGVYGSSAYILFTNGNLYTAGINSNGQLGLGDTTERTMYTLSNTEVTQVYTSPSSGDRTLVNNRLIIKKSDNKIYGCGYNEYGQLGLGNTTITISSWTEMTWCGTSPLSVWNMGALVGCTFCQKSDGTVFAAGYNLEGQLGNSSTAAAVSTAVDVTDNWLGGTFAATGMVIQQVVGGYGYFDGNANNQGSTTMFLDNGTASRIAGAGANSNGQLGDTTTNNRSTPVTPTGFSGRVRQIGRMGGSQGSIHVVKTDNAYWNWGYNVNGQLGRGNTTSPISTPAQVRTDVLQMFSEYYATYGFPYATNSPILETATGYFIAGNNLYSALGVGDATDRNVFTQMRFPGGTRLSLSGIMSTNNNAQSRYAVDTFGNFYVWGYNLYNGLMDSTTVDIRVPQRISIPALK